MGSVGRLVQQALDALLMGHHPAALEAACAAFDHTARRQHGIDGFARTAYKRLVRDKLWLIGYVGFPGIMPAFINIPFPHPYMNPDQNGQVEIQEIVYYLIRSQLDPKDTSLFRIEWNPVISLGLSSEGSLILSQRLIRGLLAAVIFAPVNAAEQLTASYRLELGDQSLEIADHWGRIDLAKRLYQSQTGLSLPDGLDYRLAKPNY